MCFSRSPRFAPQFFLSSNIFAWKLTCPALVRIMQDQNEICLYNHCFKYATSRLYVKRGYLYSNFTNFLPIDRMPLRDGHLAF